MLFKRKRHHHIEAIIVAGVIVSLISIVTIVYLIKQQNLKPQNSEEFSPFAIQNGDDLSSDAVATVGQNYIKSLASYNLSGNPPIILSNIEFVEEGIWLVKYEVEQTDIYGIQVYHYLLKIHNGRVVQHNVSVSEKTRQLLVSSPETAQVFAGGVVIVKGQVFFEEDVVQDKVLVEIFDKDFLVLIASKTSKVSIEDQYTYLERFNLPDAIFGELVLKVSMDQKEVLVPFVLAYRGAS